MGEKTELFSIGKSIRATRKIKKFTQQQLADKANISVNTLSRAECGKTQLRISILIKISLVLEVSLDSLTQQ